MRNIALNSANIPKPATAQDSGSVVEIASIPRKFQTSGFGGLHQLFLPLLSLARDALKLHSTLSNCQDDSDVAYRASTYMAGELFRDINFFPARALAKIPNLYVLDFLNNRYQVETDVFAREEGASACLHVKIVGEINGDSFSIWDSSNNKEIFKFDLTDAGKPEYFDREFPFIAYNARENSAEFSKNKPDAMADQPIDMELVVSVLQKGVRVRVHKQVGDLYVQVRDLQTENDFMRLPIMRLNNIAGLMNDIEQHLNANPLASADAVAIKK